MEELFNNSSIFIFFFAMIAIFNYVDLKVNQRISIIYVTVYALVVLNIIGLKTAFFFIFLTLFCYLEVLTDDNMKLKLLVNPIYKLTDCLYLSFAQYYLFPFLISICCFYYKFDIWFGSYSKLFIIPSIILFAYSIIRVLQQKFVIASFSKMYSIFSDFPITDVNFDSKFEDACNILVAIEDKDYFERPQYTNFTFSFLMRKLKNEGLFNSISLGQNFIGNIVTGNRGYSTIPMQLIRSIGLEEGYICTIRRKIFECIYAKMFFDGFKKYLDQMIVSKRQHIKEYYLYIYFHTVEIKLGNAYFSKFLNAFDMQYDRKNIIDIHDCSKEGIFIACMGLSHRATLIDEDNIDYYLEKVPVDLDKKKILEMLSVMMDKPYNGNYLK